MPYAHAWWVQQHFKLNPEVLFDQQSDIYLKRTYDSQAALYPWM
jgi:hypothetical protein